MTSGERFTVNLNQVAIREEVVRGVLLCVQDFVRDPLFTQRNFFSETGVTTLSQAAAIYDSITCSSVYAPYSQVDSELSGWIITDLTTYFGKALDRRRLIKETSDQRTALGVVKLSSVESASQYGVGTSSVVKQGQVDYVPVAASSLKVSSPSRQQSSPGNGKKCL